MSCSFKNRLGLVGISLGMAAFHIFFMVPFADAKTFKKLVETGQRISPTSTSEDPSQDKPIKEIGEPTIGRDGQTAVLIKNQPYINSPELPIAPGTDGYPGTSREFIGMYSISKGGTIKLVEKGQATSNRSGYDSSSFTSPSISEGLIAFGTYVTGTGRILVSPTSILKVGTFGDVKSYPSIYVLRTGFGIPQVSFVNGLVYVLEESYGFDTRSRTLRLLNTRDGNPAFTTLSNDPNIREIRSGSKSLLLLSVGPINAYRLFERPHGGQFSELKPIGKNPGSCGFAVSYESVVSCSVDNGQSTLSARFGAAANFITVPLGSAIKSVSSPSISQNKIIFLATEQQSNQTVTQRIYLSIDGKTPTRVISTGDTLDGKVITKLELSNNGRAIADNYAVFTATFPNDAKALYRVDF